MQFSEATFSTSEVALNSADGPPNGSAFVVLHGGSGRWQSSQRLLDILAESWHMVAPDFRGHGVSGHVMGAYLLRDYVRDTAEFPRASFASQPWGTGIRWAGKSASWWRPSTPSSCAR